MAESTAGEIVVGCGSPTTPKRSTRLVRPTAKAKETMRNGDETPAKAARRPAARVTRASSNDGDPEDEENSLTSVLLRQVLQELKNLQNASAKQQELISELQSQFIETQRELQETRKELQETKAELKNAREQLEVITATTSAHSSPRASYAEVARTPPGSQPSNIRTLSTGNSTPSNFTETLYCTIDVSRVDSGQRDGASTGAIRGLIEAEARATLNQPSWRCRAVTVDRKNNNRIRIACRDEAEHQMIKQLAEPKIPRGARVLRDELYPVKVDNVNRLAILNELGDIRAGAAEAFGQENDVQVAKVAWLSRRDMPKAYGSMVVYLTRASDARKVLEEGFFYAGGESGYTGRFERRPRPEQCYNCQEVGHKAFQCSKPQVCGKCAKEGHHHSGCSELIPKCALCDGPHEAFSRSCRKLFHAGHE